MRYTSKPIKTLLFVLLVGCIYFQSTSITLGQPSDFNTMSLEEIASELTKTNQPRGFVVNVINKAEEEPEFRKSLINILTNNIAGENVSIVISNSVRALRTLKASETLPQLMTLWNTSDKAVKYLEFADPRTQLFLTISEFLPEEERIEFFVKTESDINEPPAIRLKAVMNICATGNEGAYKYVIAEYEAAKKKFPKTISMKLDEQKDYLETNKQAKEEQDSDGDMLPSNTELTMQLDPDNSDTDGDGLIDGNDRNPLCKPLEGELSEDQEIANFIMYLYSRYKIKGGPFESKEIVIRTVGVYDDETKPSLAANVEFTGIQNVILHMNQQQLEKYRSIDKTTSQIVSLYKTNNNEENTKEFFLSLYTGPMGGEMNRIIFKKINNIWLPISWSLAGIA